MGTRHSSLLPEDRLHGHALNSGVDLLQIARALLRQQSPFWSSVLNTLVALVSPGLPVPSPELGESLYATRFPCLLCTP